MLTFGCVSTSHTSRNRCMEEDVLQGGKGQWKKMQMLTVEDLGANSTLAVICLKNGMCSVVTICIASVC